MMRRLLWPCWRIECCVSIHFVVLGVSVSVPVGGFVRTKGANEAALYYIRQYFTVNPVYQRVKDNGRQLRCNRCTEIPILAGQEKLHKVCARCTGGEFLPISGLRESVVTNRSTEFKHVHSAAEIRLSHRMIHLDSFIPRARIVRVQGC